MSRLNVSFRHLFVKFSLAASALVLVACSSGMGQSDSLTMTQSAGSVQQAGPPATSVPAPTSQPTPTSAGTLTGSSGSTFFWAIPFTVSGLTSGESLNVVLNGIYSRIVTSDSPTSGLDLFVPQIPANYPGLPIGSTYSITIGSQPAGESCTVVNGTGTLLEYPGPSAAVISCASPPPQAGRTSEASKAIVSMVRPAATGHAPTARQGAITFTDLSGNFWLFGGSERTATGTTHSFNDLWKFSPDLGGWSRVFGSDSPDSAGHYGTLSVSSSLNTPGARASAVSWTDAAGNLWMFGGRGRDATDTDGVLSDLWKFDTDARQWTWVSGSDAVNSPGIHGVQNAPSTENRPAARLNGASWIDSAGTLWLFGGYGVDSTGAAETLDDLWQFVPAAGTWSWISGATTT